MENIVGKIKSIAVRNFLTYDELKFSPGMNLNIIIGPNGTGKSSIVAALILGCGGKPSILSRAKDVSDYVKNGKNKANIEIELISSTEEDVVVLNRSFDRESKEVFRIDGEKVSYKAFTEVVKRYNIHVDNLCMFLPQDRVQDFTKLNPQEILSSTQSSVCSPEINEAFESLKVKREEQKNLAKNNSNIQVQLEDNINRNNQLQSLIENSKLKDKLTKTSELYKKKLAWLEYNFAKLNHDQTTEDIKRLQESIDTKQQLLKPLEKRQSEIAGTKKKLQDSITRTNTLMTQFNRDVDKLMDKSVELESEIRRAKQNYRNVVANAKSHEEELKNSGQLLTIAKEEYERAQMELQATGNAQVRMKEYDKEIKSNNANIESIVNERETLNRMMDESITPEINSCRRKIDQMKDVHQQRFNILRNNFEETYQVYRWLEENRQNFRSHIYNPIITEITVSEKKYAKYIENVIATRDLLMFLCTDKDDMREFVLKVREELGLQVNVGYTTLEHALNYQSEIPLENLKKMGIYAYAIDVIEAPYPVLNYLCRLYNIHNTAIGNDRTYQCASQIPVNINVFFSTNHRFNVNVSAYTGKKSTSSSECFARNILNIGIDQSLIDREEARLQELQQKAENLKVKRISMEKRIQEIEKLQVEVRNHKHLLGGKVRSVQVLEAKYRKKEADFESLQNNRINIAEERQKNKDQVDQVADMLLVNSAKLIEHLEKYKEIHVENSLARKKLRVFDDSTGNVDEQIEKLKADMNRVMETLRRATGACETAKREMNEKKEEALKLTDNLSPEHPRFKYKEKFKEIPDERNAVQDKIFEMQGRIDCIRGVDPQVLREYEERKERIDELQYIQRTERERTTKLETELEELHNMWFPEIKRVVDTINQNFSAFFAKMGFVGEVELTRKEERDYNDYGIQIRVQYRDNEKLQALNRHVQSGGERAVAIAVYTLSLQHLTSVPFRCVDEINQGMDPKNERKIFQMLVDITCQAGQSQYFFVTPKLLPNLPHNDLMTVSVVYNGNHIEDSYVFANDDDDDD